MFINQLFHFLSKSSIYSFMIHDLQWPKQLNAPLEVADPEVADIIELEKARQWKVYMVMLYGASFLI